MALHPRPSWRAAGHLSRVILLPSSQLLSNPMCARKNSWLPYKLFEIRENYENHTARTWIVDEDDRPNHLDVYFPYGIHSDFVKFFIEHGHCLNCNAPIKEDFSRCGCTLPHYDLLFESPDFHLVIESPGYGNLIEKERLRVHRERRARRIAVSNKAVTKAQIDELFSVQEGRCYYCGVLLIDASGKRNFHKDHYRSLKNGGLHSIDNIVLACAPCNIAKREEDGDEVFFFYHKSLTQAEKRRMPKLRKKVAAFHEAQKEQAAL